MHSIPKNITGEHRAYLSLVLNRLHCHVACTPKKDRDKTISVLINRTEDEYEKLFYSINGLLLPGGEVDIERSQFARVAKIFYDLAIKANDESDYFPIWGTCLGFEQLTVLTSGKNILTVTKTEGVALPLIFTQAAKESRLFKTFPKDLLQALSTENITANYHDWSLSLQNYTNNNKLQSFYKILSTNTDGHTEFISTMEGKWVSFN
ncbi:UNVERIFIED_CONTAM: hypothetical protein FKN15_071342 [Acipenser sinensis]